MIPRITLAVCALAGCAAGTLDREEAPTVAVDELSTLQVAVGDPITAYGRGFATPEEGWVDLVFEGLFHPDDGSEPEVVDLSVPLHATAVDEVSWRHFGGYRIPFGATAQRAGTFVGDVWARNRYFDGAVEEPASAGRLRTRLRVLPSLAVLDFRAVGDGWVSDCVEPATSALNLVPYALRVRAVGFEPAEIVYRVTRGLLVDGEATSGTTEHRHRVHASEHGVIMQFAPVPEHLDGYRMSVVIEAIAVDGSVHSLTYPFVVRRPLEVYFDEPWELGEVYPASPVSGCIPGGPGGVTVTYSESHSETRTRSTEHTVTSGWEQRYGEEHEASWSRADTRGESQTAGRTVTVSDATTRGGSVVDTDLFSATQSRARTHRVDFSRTATDEYEWGVHGERGWSSGVEGWAESRMESGSEGSIGIGIEGFSLGLGSSSSEGFVTGERRTEGTSGSVGWNSGASHSSGTEASRGSDASASASATESRSRATGRHWERTQTYSEANSFSRTQMWESTETYGEAVRRSQSLAESLGTSDTEIYTLSTTDAESLETQATVWAGHVGMWYRQASRLVRRGTVVAYDLCGNGDAVGRVELDDWAWAPDLAIAETCPPPSNFGDAECFVSPCSLSGR